MRSPITGGVAMLVAVAALALAGCSSDESGQQASDPSSTATTASEIPGSADPGAIVTELPDDYPTDDVPLLDAPIVQVLVNADQGTYLVNLRPETDFPTAFNAARKLLEDEGFEAAQDVISAGPQSSTVILTSEHWEVLLTGGDLAETGGTSGGGPGGDVALQYTVTPR